MGDFARLGVAAAVGNVGLQDIDRLVLDKLAQPPAVTLHLAGGQGDPGRAAQIGEGTGVVLLQRLLEPGEIAVFDGAAEVLGLDGIEKVVGVDHEVDIVADRLADDPHGSEEHTSELQSLMRISYAVFCSKKKNKF